MWPGEAGEGGGSCLPGSVSQMLGQSQSLCLIRRFLLLSPSLSPCSGERLHVPAQGVKR